MRGNALDVAHRSINPILRVYLNQQMDVVGHNLQFQNVCADAFSNTIYQFLQSRFYLTNQNLTPVLRTPDNMIFTGIDNIPIRFIFHEKQYTKTIKLMQDILCFQRLTPALKGGACAACSVKAAGSQGCASR